MNDEYFIEDLTEDLLEDEELARIVRKREGEPGIKVDINDL